MPVQTLCDVVLRQPLIAICLLGALAVADQIKFRQRYCRSTFGRHLLQCVGNGASASRWFARNHRVVHHSQYVYPL